jgi:hypothetical protein
MKENKKKCGFGKILLGIAIAAVATVAYKKVPAVKNISDTICNSVKNGFKKLGEKATELGAKNNNTEAASAPAGTNTAN